MDCKCGERMWLEQPDEVMLDFIPGSPEIKILFLYAVKHNHAAVWWCYGCGTWLPTRLPVPTW